MRLGTRRALALPASVTRALRLRKGATLEVTVLGKGVYLVPTGRIPKDQRYFYTPEWQTKEREADEAIASGNTKAFSDVEALIRDLRGR